MNLGIGIAYVAAAILFIIGVKQLSKIKIALNGNRLSMVGMIIAVAAALTGLYIDGKSINWSFIISGILIGSVIGVYSSRKVKMTSMPEMVAIFNGFGGGASLLVGLSSFLFNNARGYFDVTTVVLSVIIGTVTFIGSIIAFGKLQGFVKSQPILFPGRNLINLVLFLSVIFFGIKAIMLNNAALALNNLYIVLGLSFLLGILIVTPIGGADMPVVIALLNAYSGLAAAMAGFVLGDLLLIISGALVGASGIILTRVMCKAMNRSWTNVLFGGFGAVAETTKKEEYANVKQTSAEEIASIIDSSKSVVFVPGYGMAVAQAQGAVRDLTNLLEKKKIKVDFAIHPVAGRMPGHMNVLLAEAGIPYDKLKEMDAINDDFKDKDVVIVLGANDVVNPAAMNDKSSPIYGMPTLKVWEAKTVIVVKRSLSPGFAGIKNKLFEADNTLMFFKDAKEAVVKINHELKEI